MLKYSGTFKNFTISKNLKISKWHYSFNSIKETWPKNLRPNLCITWLPWLSLIITCPPIPSDIHFPLWFANRLSSAFDQASCLSNHWFWGLHISIIWGALNLGSDGPLSKHNPFNPFHPSSQVGSHWAPALWKWARSLRWIFPLALFLGEHFHFSIWE